MGKSKKKSGQQSLASLIIKDRFSKKNPHRSADSFLHTSELDDGYDWGRLNLQSVTEQNQLDDFLATAELAGTEFTAEKLNVEIISGPTSAPAVPSESDMSKITAAQDLYQQQLRIPRRPAWHGGMSGEELQALERQEFLEWRRSLAELQDKEHLVITPFERNLDFWRQLWRVIERSDIVVQIVDSRNPLLFRCEDLEKYVKEVDNSKQNVILINKSDYLTEEQRKHWCEYFTRHNVKVFFWSAKLEAERAEALTMQDENSAETSNTDGVKDDESTTPSPPEPLKADEAAGDDDKQEHEKMTTHDSLRAASHLNSYTLHSATELVEELKLLRPEGHSKDILTIGMVGYPNVGKSSTINTILQAKKCPVSSTPGRTKHFQTLYIDQTTMLCDCPGLVMPSFVSTKAEMILNGILPIDQMRDHKPAVNTLAHKIPRLNLELTYGIMIRKPKEGEDPHRPPTDLELLNAYGAMRGFMTSSGVPDCPRSARILLKDYVAGKLLYCDPPPEVPADVYGCTPQLGQPTPQVDDGSLNMEKLDIVVDNSASKRLDMEFFQSTSDAVHAKGKAAAGNTDKPFSKKHGNRKKKEKVRRLYGYLDKHDAY